MKKKTKTMHGVTVLDVERSNPGDIAQHSMIKRILTAYEEDDLLYASGIPVPDYLDVIDAVQAKPNVLIELRDGGWLGLLETSVGYGGSGPRNTYDALRAMGIEDELSQDITYSRYSDVDFDNLEAAIHSDHWPRYNFPWPMRLGPSQNHFVFILDPPEQERPDRTSSTGQTSLEGGARPTPALASSLEECLHYLDGAPDWVGANRDSRVVWAWEHWETSEQLGFVLDRAIRRGLGRHSPPAWFNVIIEQGHAQIWMMVLEDKRWPGTHVKRLMTMAGVGAPRDPVVRRLTKRRILKAAGPGVTSVELRWRPSDQ